jgi:tungstate transport system substrate-binding protein
MPTLRRACLRLLAALAAVAALAPPLLADDDKFIIVQSTTSTEQSGLFGHILPLFTETTGIEVRVVAVGTGQAIKNAQNGDGDVLFVHSKPDEERFVAEGWGVKRFDVMYNDFVVVGPRSDPVGVKGGRDAAAALKQIAAAKAPFASRGDDSGTHKAELKLWQLAGVDVKAASGTWYRETGSGMGPTLNTAAGMNAYALTDRGTWLSFQNKGDLEVLVEGDDRLFNQYGVMLVNPEKHPHVKAELGQRFVDWLIGRDGQAAIASYKINGEQLFFPNAPAAS